MRESQTTSLRKWVQIGRGDSQMKSSQYPLLHTDTAVVPQVPAGRGLAGSLVAEADAMMFRIMTPGPTCPFSSSKARSDHGLHVLGSWHPGGAFSLGDRSYGSTCQHSALHTDDLGKPLQHPSNDGLSTIPLSDFCSLTPVYWISSQ